MLYFKCKSTRSWLHHKFGKVLSGQLADRLVRRCHGEKGVFLTLTYRRSEYEDARDLYEKAGQERHVRKFIERLSKALNTSLSGRWLCKLEFQRGGWVHWHLLILGIDFISHSLMTETWGHGFVWVRRMTEATIRYTCKYVAKGGELPAWLFLERVRSVKIIRASPGFWLNPKIDRDTRTRDDVDPSSIPRGCYVCIGELIDRASMATVIRDDARRYGHVKIDPWRFLAMVKRCGGVVVGADSGWIAIDGVGWSDVDAIASDAASRSAAAPAASIADAALHLIDGGNPPVPKYVERFFLERFGGMEAA